MLRPEPLAVVPDSSIAKIMVGFPVSCIMRPATIPKTPSCQPCFAKIWTGAFGSIKSSASLAIVVTMSFRSLFCWSIYLAISSACSSSNVVINSTPGAASPNRPNAFKRGPMVKPIDSSETASFFTPASCSKTSKPIRSPVWIIWRPILTNVLFSSVNETKSAIVPIATKSNNSIGNSPSNAVATLKATPTPAKSPKG